MTSLVSPNDWHAGSVIGLQSVWESFSKALLHWHADSVIGLKSVWESFSKTLLHWINVLVILKRACVAIKWEGFCESLVTSLARLRVMITHESPGQRLVWEGVIKPCHSEWLARGQCNRTALSVGKFF